MVLRNAYEITCSGYPYSSYTHTHDSPIHTPTVLIFLRFVSFTDSPFLCDWTSACLRRFLKLVEEYRYVDVWAERVAFVMTAVRSW